VLLICVEWCTQFGLRGLADARVPSLGPRNREGVGALVGAVLFNFSFVVTVPSVIGLKKRAVSPVRLLRDGVCSGTILMAVVGALGALGAMIGNADGSGDTEGIDDAPLLAASSSSTDDAADLLAKLQSDAYPPLTRAAAFAFPPAALLTLIPVYSIIARDNLVASGLLGARSAATLAVAAPWLGALALYPGDWLVPAVEWSGLVLIVPLNFVLPAALYLCAVSADERSDRSNVQAQQQRQEAQNQSSTGGTSSQETTATAVATEATGAN
jgi:hypothetical protein